MSDSIFEIREYLDSDGKVNSHDVTDISKELEYMEKLVNSMQEQPTALNDDDQFIRDLALLSQDQSTLEEQSFDDDFFEKIEANEAWGPPKKAVVVKKATGEKQKSGWGKGFLSQSKPTTKVTKTSTPTTTTTKNDASTDSLASSAEKLSLNDTNSTTHTTQDQSSTNNNTTNTTVKLSLDKSPAALKGILKHATFVTPSTTTLDIATPSNTTTIGTGTPNNTTPTTTTTHTTTAEPLNQAFSGSIMERAPTKTVAKLGTGSKGVILGGPRKNV